MGEYSKKHKCCPKCGGLSCSITLMGFPMDSDNREACEDKNNCVCQTCGDRHIKHDRVPLKNK